MLKSGLVSVSFRSLPPEEIVRLAAGCGLGAIEWGGDVHVPPGDIANAARVGEMTRAAGLAVSSYGSYYRLGAYGDGYGEVFSGVLRTAAALGAPVVRLWAGRQGSAETPEETRRRLTEEAVALGGLAKKAGVHAAFECHGDTLTDRFDSALRLMADTAPAGLGMYWQTNQRYDHAYNLAAARALMPYTRVLHVFNWPDPATRAPLAEAREPWLSYLSAAAADGADRYCLLEFMPDDDPRSLPAEAAALNDMLSSL